MGVTELQVTVDSVEVIRPLPSETQPLQKPRRFFLSNIDQILAFTVYSIHFFRLSRDHSFSEVVRSCKTALREVLRSYEFLAGRLSMNEEQERLEIECNGKGVPFAVGRASKTMEELGRSVYLSSDFKGLVLNSDHNDLLPLDERPLFLFQITELSSGSGLVIGVGINHGALDGISIYKMLLNVFSVATGNGLLIEPNNDRTLLKARIPPQIEHKHDHVRTAPPNDSPYFFRLRYDDIEYKSFELTGATVSALKKAVVSSGNVDRCTTFQALTAHLWRARTAALEMPADEISWVMFPVDIRSCVVPPLPPEYSGNAVLLGYACAAAGDVTAQDGYGKCVQLIKEGIKRVSSDSYVRSCIDWKEIHKGGRVRDGQSSVTVSSWLNLKANGLIVPWGAHLYSRPAASRFPGLVLLVAHPTDEKGALIHLGLPPPSMALFTPLFYNIKLIGVSRM